MFSQLFETLKKSLTTLVLTGTQLNSRMLGNQEVAVINIHTCASYKYYLQVYTYHNITVA